VNRLMATGMALSRQSEQLIKALQKRKDTAGSGVSADAKAILAAAATARATPAGQQPGAPASRPMKDMPARNPGLDSPGTAGSPAPDPREAVSGDRGPAEPGNSPSAIQYRNRQERRQAERQAVKAAARQNTQHNHAGHPAIMAA
jgi:hypothetical protein